MRRITYIGPAKLEFENGGILSLDDQYEKAQRAQMYPNIEPTIPPAEPYVRPSDWLTIPDVNAGDEAFYGLFAIFDHDSNYAKIFSNTNYLVDWGVGAGNVYYAGNTYATQYYDFAAFDNSTLTSRGYKQAVIKVYPASGSYFDRLDVCVRDQSPVAQTNWLDIAVGGPNLTYLGLNQNYGNRCGYLEQVKIEQNKIGYDWNSMFSYCYSLQNVRYIDTRTATNINGLYYNCRSLASIPDIVTNTPLTGSFSDVFALCYSLRKLPWVDLSQVTNVNHLHDYTYITKHPPYNLNSINSLYQAFWRTTYLRELPSYNTSKVTNFSAAFKNLPSLRKMPTLDARAVIDEWDGAWGYNYNLEIVDNFITGADNTSKGDLWNGSGALTSLGPGFNTVNSVNIDRMFVQMNGLKYTPAITAPNATSAFATFQRWYGAPLKFSAPLLTNAQSICQDARPISIDFDLPSVTNLHYAFGLCYNVVSINLKTTSTVTRADAAFLRCHVFKAPAINLTNVQDCNYLYSYAKTAIIPEASEQDWSNVRIVDGTFDNNGYLWSVPAYNWGNVTSMSNTFAFAGNLFDIRAYGMTCSFNVRDTRLGKSATEYMFNNLGVANAAAQTVTVSYRSNGNYRSVVSKTVTTTAGSKTVTCSDTSNLVTGYCVTGTGITSTVAVTFTDIGSNGALSDCVNLTAHGLANGTAVGFTSITTTTGISTYTVYYVVNAEVDKFQLSQTQGGSVVPLTNDGSGTMYYANYIASIITNTSVTLTAPASASGTVTMSATWLDTAKAVIKGWAVAFPV